MKLSLKRTVGALLLFGYLQAAWAADNVERALLELKSRNPEAHAQIAEALNQSPATRNYLQQVPTFSGFEIINVADRGNTPYAAFVKDGKIVISKELLTDLKKRELMHHAPPGTIFPNQTLFVVSHLAYHVKGDRLPSSRMPNRDEFIRQRIAFEAKAYIHSWNALIDWVISQNAGKPLEVFQVGELLLQTRYRGIYNRAFNETPKLKMEDSGHIRETPDNVEAISGAIAKSPISDIE